MMSNEKWATPKGDKPTINLPGTIEHNYISKQRVRDAINKIEMYAMTKEAIPTHIKAINDLRQELGVDDNDK